MSKVEKRIVTSARSLRDAFFTNDDLTPYIEELIRAVDEYESMVNQRKVSA